ncbi:universal stress protein [Spirosoma taeanense]|uniref:Universal stress protein n=1 Tax=Spirosoma taeanense TaxID=2735870 RepID=A0A6M5Y9T2_9BACT|nr:universal stress protein [Spirosoma taeanense]QJW89971.1 universal stress protein [Spirosoma taeanense]
MKKILVLTDFSEASHNALAVARSLFSEIDADFNLLCVHPQRSQGFTPLFNFGTARVDYDDLFQNLLMELQGQASTERHTFRSSVCPGQLLQTVERAVLLEGYDLVVIGARKDSFEWFGQRATNLIDQLKSNLLIVPVNMSSRRVHEVVLATDLANPVDTEQLSSLKELITIKGASLVLLNIDTPPKSVMHYEKETLIQQYFTPIQPAIVHLQALDARQGIDAYLAAHSVDLLVTIPYHRWRTDRLASGRKKHAQPFIASVPMLTLYDDGSKAQSKSADRLATRTYVRQPYKPLILAG